MTKTYPPGSILAEMEIEIYANKDNGEITVLHDRPFQSPLSGLEFMIAGRELYFVYTNDTRQPFGEPVNEALAAYLSKAAEAVFYEINKETRKPVNSFTVPVQAAYHP